MTAYHIDRIVEQFGWLFIEFHTEQMQRMMLENGVTLASLRWWTEPSYLDYQDKPLGTLRTIRCSGSTAGR